MFLCYIESWTKVVPHMEPLPADSLIEARLQARRLLRNHTRPLAAHIFVDGERIDTIVPDTPNGMTSGAL